MKAYMFPGQGSQLPGMGSDLADNDQAKLLFEKANQMLGFNLTDLMFNGTKEALTKTGITQPAIFLHSVVLALTNPGFNPDMVAGHSLGEFSALVANRTLKFKDGMGLVAKRASAMQKACELQPGTMAAVLGLEASIVEGVCESINDIVVPANYNCPGQLVISGTIPGVEAACTELLDLGARKAIKLPVSGAFHSPLMEPAREELAKAISEIEFHIPACPIIQNTDAKAHIEIDEIKENLIAQLTAPVRWTQSVQLMIELGGIEFIETGPGKVLQGLVRKINPEVSESAIA